MKSVVLLLAAAMLALPALAIAADETDSLASSSRPIECAGVLLAISPCLTYVASPPNNETSTPSRMCCEAFDGGKNNDVTCLCHLIWNPSLLGFPINISRIDSLFSSCGSLSGTSTGLASAAPSPAAAAAFRSLCQGGGDGPDGEPEAVAPPSGSNSSVNDSDSAVPPEPVTKSCANVTTAVHKRGLELFCGISPLSLALLLVVIL